MPKDTVPGQGSEEDVDVVLKLLESATSEDSDEPPTEPEESTPSDDEEEDLEEETDDTENTDETDEDESDEDEESDENEDDDEELSEASKSKVQKRIDSFRAKLSEAEAQLEQVRAENEQLVQELSDAKAPAPQGSGAFAGINTVKDLYAKQQEYIEALDWFERHPNGVEEGKYDSLPDGMTAAEVSMRVNRINRVLAYDLPRAERRLQAVEQRTAQAKARHPNLFSKDKAAADRYVRQLPGILELPNGYDLLAVLVEHGGKTAKASGNPSSVKVPKAPKTPGRIKVKQPKSAPGTKRRRVGDTRTKEGFAESIIDDL